MKTSVRIALPCAVLLGALAGVAQAQVGYAPIDREVWGESSRTMVWMNAYGQCWQSAFGPPPPPGVCGIPVAQVVVPAAPAPVVIAPPPQQPRQAVMAAPPAAPPAPAPAPYIAPAAPRRDRN
jgi:hypothetical protein